jgi:hypothetical protein
MFCLRSVITLVLGGALLLGAAGECFAAPGDCAGSYKLPKPGTYDMGKAGQVITCVLAASSIGKEIWWKGAGLAGVAMIPREPFEAFELFISYAALFDSGLHRNSQTKIEAAAGTRHAAQLALNDPKSKLWALRRERFFALEGITFTEQYVYGPEGTYGRVIASLPVHQNLRRLANALSDATELYLETKGSGFDDATLGDALGMAAAFLKRRGVFPPDFTLDRSAQESLPFSQGVYDEVFASVLGDMDRQVPFFYALKDRMAEKKLAAADLLPAAPAPQPLLDLVLSDFGSFKKVRRQGTY